MKSFAIVAASILVGGTALFAHGDNDHVRGTVTAVSPQSITVQTPEKTTVMLAVTPQTTFEKSGDPAKLADVTVGTRVVVDVPKDTKAGAPKEARLVRFGAAKKAAAATGAHHHPE
jgi:hypothetical protein